MESTGNNIVPSSGQTTPSPSDLHVLLVHQGSVVVSMFAKKLYVCLHKVAIAPSNMVDQVLRILREKVCLCEGIICEEASSAAPGDNALLQTIMNLAYELHINFEVVSPSLARIWSGTSDACLYTSRGDMHVYAVQMRWRANQMIMEHQRISSSSVAIGSSQVASADNNNNEITAASDIEDVRRNYSRSDQQLAEAKGSDSSPPTKKRRCVWTPQLHGAFQEAFNDLASMPRAAAVPKKILEWMKRKKNIPDWISRENIASHLQKYRKLIAKQQSQPTTMQQGGLLTDIPTSSRSISNPTKTSVAPVMPSNRRSDPAICNMAQLNISGLDHSALGIGEAGYNLTRSSTMDLMHLNEDAYQMSQCLGRDPSASGLGEVDWSNFLTSQLNGYRHHCSDEVLRSLVINKFEHHCPNHDSMFGRPAVGSIQHGLSFIANDQHNGGIGLGQQCPNPSEVGLFNQRSSFIANDQHNGGTGFRQQCPNSDSIGLVNQYGSSFIANDQTYNAVYVPVGNAGFDFGQQQPNQNYNSEVQSNSVLPNNVGQQGGSTIIQNYMAEVHSNSFLPNLAQQGGSTIIQNYMAEVHSNSFLPNLAQQGGSTIIQNYNPEVQIDSVPPNVAQHGGSTRFINTVPEKPT